MTDHIAITEPLLLNEDLIKEYLVNQPEFFTKHPDILQTIRLPHKARGTISLVEKQQEVLRNKVQNLETEITELMTIARRNEQIFLTFSELYRQIIECNDAENLYQTLLNVLNDKLNLSAIYLKKFSDQQQDFHLNPEYLSDLFQHRFSHQRHYFGRLNKSEQQLLFPQHEQIQSAAIMLLGDDQPLGIIAFGSRDEQHFTPSMDTLFINELGKMIALMLEKF